jgi:hypothetical protein
MKLLLIIVGVSLIAASILADYKWRQWMAARRRDRGEPDSSARR